MNKDTRLSPLAAEMAASMSEFCDALEAGEAIEKRFTVRTITLDLQPTEYGPADVKRVRAMQNTSQALLAQFLGVSVGSVRAWEHGTRDVPTIARRFLDEIVADPELWGRRIRHALETRGRETCGS